LEKGEGRLALAAAALEVSPSLRPNGTSQKGPNACHMQNIEIGSISKKKFGSRGLTSYLASCGFLWNA